MSQNSVLFDVGLSMGESILKTSFAIANRHELAVVVTHSLRDLHLSSSFSAEAQRPVTFRIGRNPARTASAQVALNNSEVPFERA